LTVDINGQPVMAERISAWRAVPSVTVVSVRTVKIGVEICVADLGEG
jgi:hypothetical protein